MSGPVDKRLKLDQPPGIYLKSTDTRPIKATKLAPDTIRANEIVIESFKTGKVTAVVAILKVFGDNTRNSRNANPGKLLNKPNKRLNSKKKHLNRALKRPNELNESASDTSERLIVKQKTIRVLLDTGSSGDLLFVRKGSQKYIPTLKWAVPQSWGTVIGHGIDGKYIPIMAHLAKARRWSKRRQTCLSSPDLTAIRNE
jgi:hypothetical protein